MFRALQLRPRKRPDRRETSPRWKFNMYHKKEKRRQKNEHITQSGGLNFNLKWYLIKERRANETVRAAATRKRKIERSFFVPQTNYKEVITKSGFPAEISYNLFQCRLPLTRPWCGQFLRDMRSLGAIQPVLLAGCVGGLCRILMQWILSGFWLLFTFLV